MAKARRRSERKVIESSIPSKIVKIKNTTKSIEISNIYDILSNSEDDDISLIEMISTAAVHTATVTRRSSPIHIFYCDYTKIKKAITDTVSVSRDI